MKFTKANIAALTMPAGKTEYIVWDDDLPGFGIRLRGTVERFTKRFIAQLRIGSQQRRPTIGDVRKVEVEAARKARTAVSALRRLHKCPARRSARAHAG